MLMSARKAARPVVLPIGFSYRIDFLSPAEEQKLLEIFGNLPFRAFTFQGYIAKRRVVEYGYSYDFSSRRATSVEAAPPFLEPIKQRAAEWAEIEPSELVEAVITEYPAGAPIGWHRDVPQFEIIIGISLKASCRMRFKPYKSARTITHLTLEPRSAYIMSGPARWEYQHSIPPVKELRYSVTFRTLRAQNKKA